MPKSSTFFKTRKRPTPDWIIPGLLKRGNTGFIIGQPKRACKSWLLLNMAWQLSEGKPVWNVIHSKNGPQFQPPRPMRVVYFSQEDTEDDMHDRVEIFFNYGKQPNDNLWLVPKNLQNMLDTPNGMAAIIRELDEVVRLAGPIDLVIFDPMRRMHSKDENSSETIAGIWKKLDELHSKYKCATIFSHHTVKPGKDLFNTVDMSSPHAARGSGDIFGGGDAFINVVPKNTKGQTANYRQVELYFESKRGKPLYPIKMRVDFATGQAEFEGYTVGREGLPKSAFEPDLGPVN